MEEKRWILKPQLNKKILHMLYLNDVSRRVNSLLKRSVIIIEMNTFNTRGFEELKCHIVSFISLL